MRVLLVPLGIAVCVLAVVGCFVGLLFDHVLLGAAIGALFPIVWMVLAWCFFKLMIGLLSLLRWG